MNTQTENLVWVGEGINCRALTFFQATNLGEHQVSRKSPRTQWPLLVDFFRIHKTAARRSEGFLKGFTRTGKARVELLYLTRSYGSVGLHVIQRRLAAFPFFFLPCNSNVKTRSFYFLGLNPAHFSSDWILLPFRRGSDSQTVFHYCLTKKENEI